MSENTYSLGQQLQVADLLVTHELYDSNKSEWDLLLAMFEGIKAIIKLGLIDKHEREPTEAFTRRVNELYSFGYSKSVVEIFQHFLFKKPPQERQLDKLQEDELWKLFYDDSDLYGNGYEATLMDIALYAGVCGHMGILVDKANAPLSTRSQEIENMVYPYLAKYFPQAILDWDYKRDEFNRPYLNYLKLLDDDEKYRLWSPEKWEIWEMPEDSENENANAIKIDEGENPIKEIPFVWHYNFKSKEHCIGTSDIGEISRIDLSIIRNLSQIEQIINFAAYPMMRKPLRDVSPLDANTPQQDDEVGIQAVLEFDPDNPESKPDWLEAKVKDPVGATWDVIKGKIEEIYRAANIGGLASTEPTRNPQSGVAKQTDFQLLNAKLVNKAINTENTENKILYFWLKWQNQWREYKDKVKMSRPKTYDVENLAADLANALTAKTVVISKTFNMLLQKQTARQVLPGANEQELSDIDTEIEENVESAPSIARTPDMDAGKEDQPYINEGGKPEKIDPSNTKNTNPQKDDGTNSNEDS